MYLRQFNFIRIIETCIDNYVDALLGGLRCHADSEAGFSDLFQDKYLLITALANPGFRMLIVPLPSIALLSSYPSRRHLKTTVLVWKFLKQLEVLREKLDKTKVSGDGDDDPNKNSPEEIFGLVENLRTEPISTPSPSTSAWPRNLTRGCPVECPRRP